MWVKTKKFLHNHIKFWDSFSVILRINVCRYRYIQWCWYLRGPWVSFVRKDEFSVRVIYITLRIGVSWSHSLRLWFWIPFKGNEIAILSKRRNPDNLESHSSIKPIFTNIWGFRSNLVECESFIESSSPEILDLSERDWDDSNDCGFFFARGYLPLIWKDSVVHIHSPTVYVKVRLPVARDLSLENFTNSYWSFCLALLHSVSSFFSSINHLVCIYAQFLTFLINPSPNKFVFGDFNIYHEDWLTYSDEIDKPGLSK